MSTTDNKYSNRTEWRYELHFIQSGVYCGLEREERHMDGQRSAEVYKSLKV